MGFPSATMDQPGSSLLGSAQGLLTFRVCSREHRGRVLRIRSAKCSIGTAANCTLRLRAAGVRPLHCMVLRGRQGTVIRRWSGAVYINGEGVDECWLQPGDRIYIGPIELEYLGHDAPSVSSRGGAEAPSGQSQRPVEAADPGPAAQPAGVAGVAAAARGKQVAASRGEQQELGESMDRLRGELADVKRQHARQLAEQQTLMNHAAATEQQLRELTAELKAMRLASDASRSDSQQQTAQCLQQRDAQLDAVQQSLQKQQRQTDQWQTRAEEATAQLTRIQADLSTAQERYETTRRELDALQASREQSLREEGSSQQELQQLREQLSVAQHELVTARGELEAAQGRHTQAFQELDQVRQQLQEARDELTQLQEGRAADQRASEAAREELAAARRQLDQAHQAAGQEVQDLLRQRDELLAKQESIRCQFEDAQRQHQESCRELQQLQDAQRREREELASARSELEQLRSQLEQAQAEPADRDHQEDQLQQLRAQLDEAAEKLLAAEDWATQLQAQLERTQRELRDGVPSDEQAEEIRKLDDELSAARTQLAVEKERWEQERDSWDGDTRQLRQQLDEATERLREATQSLAAAKQRSAELEALLAETSQELSQRDQAARGHHGENSGVTHELAQCRELVDSARKELQQEREEHQKVRSEWHAERQNLQKELAERSQALDELQAVHAERMEEAEFLIQSLQREGKQLLSQLDEAKQELRRDNEPPHVRKQTGPSAAAPMVTQPFDTGAAAELRGCESAGAEEPPRADEPTHEVPDEPTNEVPDEPTLNLTATLVLSSEAADSRDESSAQQQVQTSVVSSDAPVSTTTLLKTQQLLPDDVQQLRSAEPVVPAQASPEVLHQGEDQVDEEGVIQQYMERLLKRVASQGREPEVGPVAGQVRSPAPPAQPQPTPQPAKGSEPTVMRHSAADAADDSEQDLASAALTGGDDANSGDSTDRRASRSRPEGAESLQAMRELANQSARSAIKRFDVRRYATIAIGELCVSTICFAASIAIIRMSGGERSTQIGGMIGMVFGATMFLRACRKLLNIRRLKKSAKADLQARTVEPAEEAGSPAEQDDTVGSVFDAAQSELGDAPCLADAADAESEITSQLSADDEDLFAETCYGDGQSEESAGNEDSDWDSQRDAGTSHE